MYHSRRPVLPIEMELGDLEINGSVSGDLKAIEEHCEKIAALKEKVLTVLKKTSSVLRFAIREIMTTNMLEGGRYACTIMHYNNYYIIINPLL